MPEPASVVLELPIAFMPSGCVPPIQDFRLVHEALFLRQPFAHQCVRKGFVWCKHNIFVFDQVSDAVHRIQHENDGPKDDNARCHTVPQRTWTPKRLREGHTQAKPVDK